MRGFLKTAGLVLGLVALLDPAAAAPRDEADRAFAEGDHARALELYELVLADDPVDATALVRSGLLLSWSERFSEALGRYERALKLDRDNEVASRERAKVLAWAGRLDEAVDAFADHLASHPGDDEARTAYARSLGWSGRYDEARGQYDRLLSERPDDPELLVGGARIDAWSGRLREARHGYRRALEADPLNKDAEIGLAYVELWSGMSGAAAIRARDLQSRHPDDPQVQELVSRASGAASPWLRVAAERIDDSDDNELSLFRLSGGRAVSKRAALEFGVARWELQDASSDASIDAVDAALTLRVSAGHQIVLGAGVDRAEDSAGDRESELLGRAAWTGGLDRRWQLSASIAREALRYSPTITDARIVYDEYGASLRGRVGRGWRLFTDGSSAEFSDDNRRVQFRSGFAWRWPWRAATVESGFALRLMEYDEDLANGYFDPTRFRAHLAQLRADGALGERGATWRLELDAGLQTFTLGGVETDDDNVLIGSGIVGVPLGRVLHLEILAGWGDYAAQTAAGFRSRQIGLRLRYSAGD